MSLEPLLNAPLQIQIHAFTAIAAFVLGVIQLIAPKGTLPHKFIGSVWVILMIVTTISAYYIQRPVSPDDPYWARFSLIHIFVLVNIFGLVSGIGYILFGGSRMKKHSGPFIGMFIGGLIVAGALAFLPGRVMHAVVFGGEALTYEAPIKK